MTLSSVLRTKDKIGYGLGDMASALVWQTATLFLAYFYTDVFGLPAAIMGTMFLVVRVVDAFVDPCIGAWLTAPGRVTDVSVPGCCGLLSRLA